MPPEPFQLTTVVVADQPDAWGRAGFVMHGAATRIGTTVIVCDPDSGERGITGVAIDGVDDRVDGLPVGAAATVGEFPDDLAHPNWVTAFDHLVAMSPAIDRTSDALIAAGLEKRRTRTFEAGGQQRRQDFFWMGDVILELVGLSGVAGEGPATFWGLALECVDLDAAARHLTDRLGRIKDAVQPGRRIATVRTDDLGISVPIALMSPHRQPT